MIREEMLLCLLEECRQIYDSHFELLEHIKEHDEFACIGCQVQFEDYSSKLLHALTFCRSPVLNKKCFYCKIDGRLCQCAILNKQIMTVIQRFVELPKQHNFFSSDLYCTLFHYYCNKTAANCVLQFENSAVILDSQLIDNRKVCRYNEYIFTINR